MGKARSRSSGTVRRSVALPADLLARAIAAAPIALRRNVNRLVRVALEEFVGRRKARAFESAMEEMAADPEVRYQSSVISEEFADADADGLPEP